MQSAYAKTKEELFKEIQTSGEGLSEEEVQKRLNKFGENKLPEKKKKSPILVFLNQFKSFLIYILVLAAVISFLAGNTIDVYVIVGVILVNAGIGFYYENKADKSIEALKNLIVVHAKVYRNKQLLEIDAKNIVPGDILFLEEGDKVPADARIIESKNLRCVESSLTGESFPVDKKDVVLPEKTALADRINCVFMGTFVASGSCKAVVFSTGTQTEIGKIAKDIESIEKVQSHFKEKTDYLAKQMAIIAFIGATITFIVGYFVRGFEFTEIFLFTLASLVSGIPEGLPAVLAIVLAVGAFRMSKRNAIVRNLPATETLGVVNTIITDKTGTLTQNTMNVKRIILPGQQEIIVSGEGWEPKGEFKQDDKIINPNENQHLLKLLKISYLCNNSKVLREKNDEDKYKILGDPTEASLKVLAEKAGLKEAELEKRIDDLPFNAELKYRASLSVLVEQENQKQIYVLGAPEAIIERSKYFLKNNNKKILSQKDKDDFLMQVEKLSYGGNRVLGLAYANFDKETNTLSDKEVKNLVIVGFVGIVDPPKKGVKEAIEKTKDAGIRVIMVTGDHRGTAVAIAKEIGLEPNKVEAYTQKDLEKMNGNEFSRAIKECNIFVRLTPSMKLKIATELQKQGEIIAMTGDGVNDAPALKKADIGVSMGVIGTDVARESSEIVLADDNFASIVNAIEEGRIVFENTRQSSGFLITTNFAEAVTVITTLSLGLPLPLLPIQILWMNLVTDGLMDVTIASEPGHGDVLNQKPRSSKEKILNKSLLPFLVLVSVIMVLTTLFVFQRDMTLGVERARTAAFVVMSMTQIFNGLNMRSLRQSLFKIKFFSNKFFAGAFIFSFLLVILTVYTPFFQELFSLVPLDLVEFLELVAISSLVFIFGEVYKLVKKKFGDKII